MRLLKKWFSWWWNVSYEHFGQVAAWREDEPDNATQ